MLLECKRRYTNQVLERKITGKPATRIPMTRNICHLKFSLKIKSSRVGALKSDRLVNLICASGLGWCTNKHNRRNVSTSNGELLILLAKLFAVGVTNRQERKWAPKSLWCSRVVSTCGLEC